MNKKKKVKKIKVKKRVFLKRVKKRLEDEVGIYFDLLFEAQSKDTDFPKVGFWAGIRLLMPVIDSLSSVLYRKSKQDPRPKSVRFMEKHLDIEYPYLVWEIYRHSLLHTDEMRGASYKNNKVTWGLSIGLNNHIFSNGHINIDVIKLYNSILNYLEKEISKNPETSVYVENHVKFIEVPNDLEREFKEINVV